MLLNRRNKKCIYIRTWPSLSITISFQPSCCLTHNILSYFFAVKDKRCLQMCIYIDIYKGKHWQFLSLLHERIGALLGKAAEERMYIKNILSIREEKWVDESFLENEMGAFIDILVKKKILQFSQFWIFFTSSFIFEFLDY